MISKYIYFHKTNTLTIVFSQYFYFGKTNTIIFVYFSVFEAFGKIVNCMLIKDPTSKGGLRHK